MSSNILFLNTSKVFGGVEKNFILRARALSDKGHHVDVVTGSRLIYDLVKNAGLKHVFLIPCGNDYDPIFFFRLLAFMIKRKPEVVFLNTKRDFWRGGLPAKLLSTKRIVGYWGSDYSVGNIPKLNFVFRNVLNVLIVNSNDLKQRLFERKFQIAPEKVRVIYNGFDCDGSSVNFKELNIRSRLGLPDDAILLGSAGRFSKHKHFDHGIDVVKALQDRHNVHYILVGEGSEISKIEQRAKELGVEDRVHILGSIPNLYRTSFYREIDIFVFFSENEGLPNVFIESLFFGTKVITYTVQGAKEVLSHERYGKIVERDISTFIRELEWCIQHWDRAKDVSFKDYVRQKFSVTKMVNDTEDAFFG